MKNWVYNYTGMRVSDERRKEAGRIGEQIAAEYLARKGFRILDRNYRKPWGEIDIIAEMTDTIRFVEVKTLSRNVVEVKTLSRNAASDVSREKDDYRPEEQVHVKKLQKIARTAEIYMNSKKDIRDYQIDVVGVILDMSNRKARCRLYEQVL